MPAATGTSKIVLSGAKKKRDLRSGKRTPPLISSATDELISQARVPAATGASHTPTFVLGL